MQPVAKISSKPSAHKQRVANKGENAGIKTEEDTSCKTDKSQGKPRDNPSPIVKQTSQMVASKVDTANFSMKLVCNYIS